MKGSVAINYLNWDENIDGVPTNPGLISGFLVGKSFPMTNKNYRYIHRFDVEYSDIDQLLNRIYATYNIRNNEDMLPNYPIRSMSIGDRISILSDDDIIKVYIVKPIGFECVKEVEI